MKPLVTLPAALALCAAAGLAVPGEEPQQESARTASVMVPPGSSLDQIVELAASVRPEPRQVHWQSLEFTAFVHFGMNTFTDREWGDGQEDPDTFQPSAFDAEQWVVAFQQAGMRGLVLTTKHHDGFCLWPTDTTEHSVKSSSWSGGQGDVVGAVAAACRKHGMEFGIYLSPWDRNAPSFGTPEYNKLFRAQLRELLSRYGPIYDVWFDGAHAPVDQPEIFDWAGHFALVRELQPGACISVCGPDARWCGNEAGHTRAAEWSVIPLPTKRVEAAEEAWQVAAAYRKVPAMAPDIGGREQLAAATRLVWWPAMTNTSIRPGWFYHAAQDAQQKSLAHLLDIYYGSVGGNTQFLLNVPPDRRGLIHPGDAARLAELGEVLRATFGVDLAKGAEVSQQNGVTELRLGEPRRFDVALLMEDTAGAGQQVEQVRLDAWVGGEWREVTRAETVGYKRLLRFPAVEADRMRVVVEQSRGTPAWQRIGLHLAPPVLEPPQILRSHEGRVTLVAPPDCEVRYTVDGREPGPEAPLYAAPFELAAGGLVRAVARPVAGRRVLDFGRGGSSTRRFGIAKAKWRVQACSSEQAPDEVAAHAIDDDPATLWHTRWSPDAPEHPHFLAIDLGEEVTLAAFGYTPRQGVLNGTIVRYRLETSLDGESWSVALEGGEFANIKNHPIAQRVALPRPVRTRYLKLVALSEVEGRAWASAAEIDVFLR